MASYQNQGLDAMFGQPQPYIAEVGQAQFQFQNGGLTNLNNVHVQQVSSSINELLFHGDQENPSQQLSLSLGSIGFGLSQGAADQLLDEHAEVENLFGADLCNDFGFGSQFQPNSILGNKFVGKRIYEQDNAAANANAGYQNAEAEFGLGGEDRGLLFSSQSSLSDGSQECTIPSLEQYPGKYNFRAELGMTHLKKVNYSPEMNKLFCLQKEPILFNFHVGCDAATMKTLFVKGLLVFSNNAEITQPVTRCITCLDEEVKTNQEKVDLHNLDDNSVYNHVLRCLHDKAIYEKSDVQKRYSVVVPLEKPQVGSTIVSRNYEFKCLSTCKGINRRRLSLVFQLLDSRRKQIGRSVMDLKVCTCPTRDKDSEVEKFQKKMDNEKAKKRAANTKAKSKIEIHKPVKQQRCVSPPSVSGLIIKNEPGMPNNNQPSTFEGHAANYFVQPNSEQTESETEGLSQSSQESFCTSTAKKIESDIRFFWELKNSPLPQDRILAEKNLSLLKIVHQSSKELKKIFRRNSVPAMNTPRGEDGEGASPPDGKSPDSGVGAKTP